MKELEKIENLIDCDWEDLYKEQEVEREKSEEKKRIREEAEYLREHLPSIRLSFKDFMDAHIHQYEHSTYSNKFISILHHFIDKSRKLPKSFHRIWDIFFTNRAYHHEMGCGYCGRRYDIFIEKEKIYYEGYNVHDGDYDEIERRELREFYVSAESVERVICFKCGSRVGSVCGKIIAITRL